MKFNFDKFMQNLGQVATASAQAYDAKQQEGKSLHQVDYIHMGIGLFGAVLAAFDSKES